MFQQFNIDTLGSRFIKSLLAQTPIPLFNCVEDGDHLVKDCYYIYKKFIIKCAVGGILAVSSTENLYPGDTLYPSVYLFPGTGFRAAQFYIVSYVDNQDSKCFSTFRSNNTYYDSDTHYHLGRYLRYYYSLTGINLMPYYNCYNSKTLGDIQLNNDYITTSTHDNEHVSVSRVSAQTKKVVAVPILFGKNYNIYVDCPTEVLVRACLYDNAGLIAEQSNEETSTKSIISENLAETLRGSGKVITCSSFNKAISFRIETSESSAMRLERCLYLVIQLPLDNNSSIVVLENFDDVRGISCDENSVRKLYVKPSLLKLNTRCSFAFSDRLIEHLLGNVITSNDLITKNVEKVQDSLSDINLSYKVKFAKGEKHKGIWDKDICNIVMNLLESNFNRNEIYDHDGFINKDVEQILQKRGILY